MTLDGAKNRDKILTALIEIRSKATISLSQHELVIKTHIEHKALISYLELMRQDKYIEITLDNPRIDRTWRATHLGLLFMSEEGGYEGVYLADTSAKRHEVQLETEMRVNNTWMRRATIGAAIFSGLYLLWSVLSFLWEYHFFCCH